MDICGFVNTNYHFWVKAAIMMEIDIEHTEHLQWYNMYLTKRVGLNLPCYLEYLRHNNANTERLVLAKLYFLPWGLNRVCFDIETK